jgi:formate hydrogenlyase subunit 3/multisubunit Na+/H+ antiporter MnhD subunit
MNAAQVHLLLNHVPVIGTIIATLLLALGIGMRSRDVIRVTMGLLVVLALSGVVVYVTGEPAEHLVEDLPGVEHDTLEEHEEFSLLATIALGIVGLVSLVGLVRYWRAARMPRGFAVATLVLSIIASAMMGWTAHLGGLIRHEEIRPQAAAVAGQPAGPGDARGR